MSVDIVVGLQHGDEGKGKVVADLIKNNSYDYCVRFNGGPNAGHTLYLNNVKIVTHHIPSGIIHNIPSIIGPGCVIDLHKLKEEITMLETHGIPVKSLLKVAYNAHVITNQHIMDDIKNDAIGSTHSGIRPVYRDKYNRCGTRIGDLDYTGPFADVLHPSQIIDTSKILCNKHILCEGAQGFELDIDWGDYPYVTSSHCISGFVTTLGISPKTIDKIYGVAKIYGTYVGKKDYQPQGDLELEKLGELGGEFGSTTGRKRQCNWLNIDRLLVSINVNGVTNLIINKCDIIKNLGIYKIIYQGTLREFNNFQEMQQLIVDNINSKIKIIFSENKETI